MISLYDYEKYRDYLRDRFLEMPKKGYGQAYKLARTLNVHTTLVSQVLNGHKSFTLEQAALTCEYLGLTQNESTYFLLIVQWDRAGNKTLKDLLHTQMKQMQTQAKELAYRLKSEKKLSEEARAIFYSDWIYAAVMQLTAINEFDNLETIAEYLSITRKRANEVIDFLLLKGLCREEGGKLKIGTVNLHLEARSPWVQLHHGNWRRKSMELISEENAADLRFTAPLTLSKSDAIHLRQMIVQFLVQAEKVIEPSPSESLHCLNIDWFKVR